MNRGEIRTAILDFLRESTTNPARWTIAEVNDTIDDAYLILARATRSIMEDIDIVAAADEHFVSVPDRTLFVDEVRDKTTGEMLFPVAYQQLDRMDQIWIRNSQSRPVHYAAFGAYELILYPAYSAGGTITATCSVVPSALVSDSSKPLLPDELHQTLVHYGAYWSLLKQADDRTFGNARQEWNWFIEKAGSADAWLDSKIADRLNQIGQRTLRRGGGRLHV